MYKFVILCHNLIVFRTHRCGSEGVNTVSVSLVI